MSIVSGSYNILLVILSIMIAITSSYAALLIIRRMMHTDQRVRRNVWLGIGSLVFGAGIWCMHFVAMLALDIGVEVSYDPTLVLISIAFAAVSSFGAFSIIAMWRYKHQSFKLGAVFISIGILSMHYIGMEAMRTPHEMNYNPFLIVISVLIALFASYTALRIFAFYSLRENLSVVTGPIISAFVMGGAIAGVHYTGMASATFRHQDYYRIDETVTGWQSEGLAYSIATIMTVILILVFLHLYYDRRLVTANTKLDFSHAIYKTIVQSASDAIVTADVDGQITSWNKSAEAIFGYSEEEVLQKSLTILMPEQARPKHVLSLQHYLTTGEGRVIDRTVELQGLHKRGEVLAIELSLSVVESLDNTYFIGIMRDVTERQNHQKRIQELVYLDELTNLPNRKMLREQLAQAIREAEKADEEIGVAFIDMDRFKKVNDVYGHEIGDELLKQIANRMSGSLHPKDVLGRQSGDEFILIARGCTAFKISSKSQQLISEFQRPFIIQDIEIFISPSIGISMFPHDASDAEGLIKNADVAMDLSKQLGGQQFQFFTSEMNERISKQLKMEDSLRKAIENEEFVLFYQPQVCPSNHQIIGAEALIRWNNQELGHVSPMEFIPLAEQTRLILPIGEWVLESACRDFVDWTRKGYRLETISVNISAIQFKQDDFIGIVEKVLIETQMPVTSLVLELTESIIQDVEKALPTLHRLKNMGIKLSLDDFGTGYSSLQYLKDFPLDSLKIDKSFIDFLSVDPKNQAVVETIVTMAKKLGMDVVAEGVETNEQWAYLSRISSIYGQGYLFSPPLPVDEFIKKYDMLSSAKEPKSI